MLPGHLLQTPLLQPSRTLVKGLLGAGFTSTMPRQTLPRPPLVLHQSCRQTPALLQQIQR